MVHSHTDLLTFRNDPLKRNAINVTFTTNGKVPDRDYTVHKAALISDS